MEEAATSSRSADDAKEDSRVIQSAWGLPPLARERAEGGRAVEGSWGGKDEKGVRKEGKRVVRKDDTRSTDGREEEEVEEEDEAVDRISYSSENDGT